MFAPLDKTNVGPVALVLAANRTHSPTLFPKAVTEVFVNLHKPLVKETGAHVFMAEESDHWVHLQQADLVEQAIRMVFNEMLR